MADMTNRQPNGEGRAYILWVARQLVSEGVYPSDEAVARRSGLSRRTVLVRLGLWPVRVRRRRCGRCVPGLRDEDRIATREEPAACPSTR